MGHGGDVIQELTTGHREVDDLFGQIGSLPSSNERRKELVDKVTIELVRHSVAEEQHLYPAVREHLHNGNELADKETADHQRVEGLLKDLENRAAEDPQFDGLLMRLQHEVTAHVQDEESRLFPMLRASCPTEMLEELGEQVRSAKERAPTRPHPNAPDSKLLTLGTGLVDRARDMLSGRGAS